MRQWRFAAQPYLLSAHRLSHQTRAHQSPLPTQKAQTMHIYQLSYRICRVETHPSVFSPMRLPPHQTVRADLPHTAFHRVLFLLSWISTFLWLLRVLYAISLPCQFRVLLTSAQEETGTWFLMPLRSLKPLIDLGEDVRNIGLVERRKGDQNQLEAFLIVDLRVLLFQLAVFRCFDTRKQRRKGGKCTAQSANVWRPRRSVLDDIR